MDTTTFSNIQVAGLLVLVLWSAIWKGFALWRAGGQKDKAWFIVLFVLNTAGILEILYLFVFSKRSSNTAQ